MRAICGVRGCDNPVESPACAGAVSYACFDHGNNGPEYRATMARMLEQHPGSGFFASEIARIDGQSPKPAAAPRVRREKKGSPMGSRFDSLTREARIAVAKEIADSARYAEVTSDEIRIAKSCGLTVDQYLENRADLRAKGFVR